MLLVIALFECVRRFGVASAFIAYVSGADRYERNNMRDQDSLSRSSMACAFALLVLLSVPSAARADITGNLLFSACTADKTFVKGYVTGFAARALVDAGAVAYSMSEVTIREERAAKKLAAIIVGMMEYCMPNNVTIVQATDVLCVFLNDHPGVRHQTAALLTSEAFSRAWPCKK